MRIRDWSSDVCSADLGQLGRHRCLPFPQVRLSDTATGRSAVAKANRVTSRKRGWRIGSHTIGNVVRQESRMRAKGCGLVELKSVQLKTYHAENPDSQYQHRHTNLAKPEALHYPFHFSGTPSTNTPPFPTLYPCTSAHN